MKTLYKNILYIAIAFAGGIIIGNTLFQKDDATDDQHEHSDSNEIWTCSMHPQIRQNEPGQCPICGMDLIVLEQDGEGEHQGIKMSPTAMQLAQIQTMKVSSGASEKTIRLNGKVYADERKLYSQTSHISGRIEALEVNFTGELVKKGQVLAYIYSPELITAQEELFQAKKIQNEQPSLYTSALNKLKNWKISEAQVQDILESGKVSERFPVLADVSGYVTTKFVQLGDHIKNGSTMYTIADLSSVWVQFDAYESDLAWIHTGDQVNFTVASVPGEQYTGTISYIDPIIDPKTRVAKARLVQSNSNLRLKPEMFVTGTVSSELKQANSNISVPKSAIMWTGKRSVAYVKSETDDGIYFQMREVVLGPELGDAYVITSGLKEGEEIAIHGTFSIDAAAQLAGKESMMNHETSPSQISIIPEATKALNSLFQSYFDLKKGLASDDFKSAQTAGKAMKTKLAAIKMSWFDGDGHTKWMQMSKSLSNALEHIHHIDNIKSLRDQFMAISNAVISMAETFGVESSSYVQHCPMANSNKGADWLSLDKEILNPYFGKSMQKCGETRKEL